MKSGFIMRDVFASGYWEIVNVLLKTALILKFCCVVFLALIAVWLDAAADEGKRVRSDLLLQVSPVAGFPFYEGAAEWARLREGDVLELVREPGNPYDPLAVRVDWQGHKLGYVPREDNEAVARLMARGVRLEARIVGLQKSRRPRDRVRFEIYIIDESRSAPPFRILN